VKLGRGSFPIFSTASEPRRKDPKILQAYVSLCRPKILHPKIKSGFLSFRRIVSYSDILVGRPEGRRPLGRPRRIWEDNIKMDLREIEFGDLDWIHWARDRDRWQALVNTVMNLRVP
jgi:hypothetical protein